MNRREVLMRMCGVSGAVAVMPTFPAPAALSTKYKDEDHLCPVCGEPYYFKEDVQLTGFDVPRFYRSMTHAYIHTHGEENLCIEATEAMPAQQYPGKTGIKYWSKHSFNPDLCELGRGWAEERNASKGMILDFSKCLNDQGGGI